VPLELTFTADDGTTTDLRTCTGGKPAVLALVYYRCPMLCNLVVEGLVRALCAVELTPGSDYRVVLVSIDPKERPEDGARRRRLLQGQGNGRQGGAGWSFLTGSSENVGALARSVGFGYVYDPKTDQYAHAAGILVLDRHGAVSRFYSGIDYPPRDLRLGLVESSDGMAGTFADRLLLLCYHYDPATGRYGLAVFAVLRVLAVLTVLGLGCGIGFMVWQQRRGRI
jgi:protein SCO1/2